MVRIAWAVLFSLAAVSSGFADPPAWVKVTEKAAFSPRDSCGELVYKDRLWIMGGWMDSFKDPPRDVWSSADGKEWTRAVENAAWKHSDFPMTTVFQEKMWIMGGWHGGRLPHASASNSVWSSTDGAEWKLETEAAGWSPRMCAGLVVFNNRMWVLGGTQKYYYGDENDLKNDVWSSADGVRWEQVTAEAPWSPRAYIAPVAVNGKLYVFGGGNYQPKYQAKNDVWSSADGKTWTLEAEQAPWSPRIWFTSAVYRDRMWILGGWSNNPARNWPDVWHSLDGMSWTELKAGNNWKERHEHSSYVFQDKLWVVSGMSPPLNSEVWSLALPKDWKGE